MNRYRRYPQIHAATTAHLSLVEEGAYGRLLDWQYSNESPLPSTPQERYRITRAISAAERPATEKIAATFFNAAGWQPRAREEIESDGRSRGEKHPPEPAPREQAAPPVAAVEATPAVATPASMPLPEAQAPSPSAIPKAVLDLGLKLLAAPGIPEEEIWEFLQIMGETMGYDRSFELLRVCERKAITNPVAWLDKAMDAHEAAMARSH